MAEDGAVDVGTAYVTIAPSARGFAAKLRTALSAEVKKLDIDDLISAQLGRKPISIPVKLDLDQTGFAAKVDAAAAKSRAKVKVDLDVDRSFGSKLGSVLKGVSNLLPDIGGFTSKVGQLGSALQGTAGSSAKLGGDLAGAFQSATGPIGLVISGLVAAAGGLSLVASAAVLAVPAISAVAGAIAAIPAATVGGASALGTLALGLRGVAAAFKPAVKAGGGGAGEDAASRARRIAGAERGIEAARRGIAAATRGLQAAERGYQDAIRNLSSAQDRVTKSQEALNKARKAAVEDLDDLNRAQKNALLDEEDAVLAVSEAERALNAARETGNIPEIQRADLAYRRALQTVDDTKDATEDLGEAQAVAAREGINGSDRVQQALREQADAVDGLRQAQEGILSSQDSLTSANDSLKASYDGLISANDSLAEAQKRNAAAGGAAAAQVIKLAPAAERFVAAVKALGPAFERLRLNVQERLFAGLDRTVTRLGDRWIPQLRITLGGYADTFNRFFRTLGTGLSQPKVIEDLAAGAEGARKGLQRILDAVAGPLVKAFATLSRAAAPFIEALGDQLAKVVESFSEWVQAGDRSTALQEFFATSTQALKDIFSIGGSVARIIGGIITIIAGKPINSGSKSPLIQFRDGLDRVAAYLNNPTNQQKIRDFLASVEDAISKVLQLAQKVGSIYDTVRKALGGDGTGESLGADIGAAIVSGIIFGWKLEFEIFKGVISSTISGLISLIKRLLGISSPSTVMAEIGVQMIAGLAKGIAAGYNALASTVGQIPGRIRAALGAAGSILYTAGQNVSIGLANGINNLVNTVANTAGRLRSAVVGAIGNASGLLYNAGRSIVQGLIDGIASMIRTLGNYLGQIGNYIRDNKGPIEKDLKLLVPAGQAIMKGLITGIASQRAALGAELGGVTGMFGGITPALAGTSFSAGAAPAPMLELAWKRGATGDKILDGVRDHITVRYNGDVDAALGRPR